MDMAIAKEELFAPIMAVVCYDEVDEAVRWLNESRFGLGAGVYGGDRRECEKVAGMLECGMVSINEYVDHFLHRIKAHLRFSFVSITEKMNVGSDGTKGVFYLNQACPFGGVKASGHGRFGEAAIPLGWSRLTPVIGGEEGLRSLCSTKTVIRDRFFSYIRTTIPRPVGV